MKSLLLIQIFFFWRINIRLFVFLSFFSAKLIGKAIPRLDIPEKVTGSAQYAIDIRPAGIVYAAVKASPVFGGKVKSFNADKARAIKGVAAVIRVGFS